MKILKKIAAFLWRHIPLFGVAGAVWHWQFGNPAQALWIMLLVAVAYLDAIERNTSKTTVVVAIPANLSTTDEKEPT